MKNRILTFAFLLMQCIAFAQTTEESTSFTTAEFRAGYGVNSFGSNLKEKFNNENFSTSGGFIATLAAYHKFKKVDHLQFGIKYKSLGAFPSKGNNGQELFFNFWGAAVSTKYFPFDKGAKKGLYVNADYFFITQFTQKYRNKPNLDFNHQFALGRGVALGLGYDFRLGNSNTMFTLGVEYEYDERTGEVTNFGDKKFISSSFAFFVGIKF